MTEFQPTTAISVHVPSFSSTEDSREARSTHRPTPLPLFQTACIVLRAQRHARTRRLALQGRVFGTLRRPRWQRRHTLCSAPYHVHLIFGGGKVSETRRGRLTSTQDDRTHLVGASSLSRPCTSCSGHQEWVQGRRNGNDRESLSPLLDQMF